MLSSSTRERNETKLRLVEHCSANAEATGSNPVEAPKSLFFGLFRNCLNCDSLRWSHTQFICIPAVHITSFFVSFLSQAWFCPHVQMFTWFCPSTFSLRDTSVTFWPPCSPEHVVWQRVIWGASEFKVRNLI